MLASGFLLVRNVFLIQRLVGCRPLLEVVKHNPSPVYGDMTHNFTECGLFGQKPDQWVVFFQRNQKYQAGIDLEFG
jgi:hypothetical protein